MSLLVSSEHGSIVFAAPWSNPGGADCGSSDDRFEHPPVITTRQSRSTVRSILIALSPLLNTPFTPNNPLTYTATLHVRVNRAEIRPSHPNSCEHSKYFVRNNINKGIFM